jgi:stress response protein YsnF
MTPKNTLTVDECIDRDLLGAEGDRIGKIHEVYMDDDTGQPEWFAVKTGWFGNNISFVPIRDAAATESGLHVPYRKDQVKGAPNVEPDGRLSQDEEASLYAHYRIAYGESRSDSGLPEGQARERRRGKSENGDTAMTRSEEELVTGTRQREAGRARLVKYVETEHVDVKVPVKRERAKLVTEPITDANRDEALDGPDIRENVHEETLYAEEPVVEKRTVPKERVRLEKEVKTDQKDIDVDLRKERIESDGDVESEVRR